MQMQVRPAGNYLQYRQSVLTCMQIEYIQHISINEGEEIEEQELRGGNHKKNEKPRRF